MFDQLDAQDPAMAGPYQLRARIGSGGMGRVYLAYTPGGRAVAVKVVRPELAEDAEFRLRFQHEVAAARRVRGLYTAELVDADSEANPPWLATAYVPGPSLHQAVSEHGPLPVRTVWLLLAGVAEALQSIHAAGVIHRDLKPANVLLAADGPRVIDFGIARAVGATPVTRTGINVGSPQFMSPEHARGERLTTVADVFSLGALAVFAATGAAPFGDGPDPAVLYRVVNEPPRLDGLPADLRQLLATCLDKDPDNRPTLTRIIHTCRVAGDVTSLKIDEGWLPDPLDQEAQRRAVAVPTPPGPPTPAAPAAEPAPQPSRRRTVLVAVGAALAAVTAVAATWTVLRPAGVAGSAQPGSPPPTSTTPPAAATIASTTATTTAVTTTTVSPTSRAAVPAPRPAVPAPRPAGPVATPVLLGRPDWAGYCQATGQGQVALIGSDAYSWRCTADNGTGNDAGAVCAWTYQTTAVTNRVGDFFDPHSWECWRATRKLGHLDFAAYCRHLGHPGARYVDGRHAYGWYCVDSPQGLDSQDACRVLYGSDPPISRFQNFYDPNSWECWG